MPDGMVERMSPWAKDQVELGSPVYWTKRELARLPKFCPRG